MRPPFRVLLLFPVLVGSGGCVTAGLAAMGPIVGSLAALGDRSVERTIPADLSTTWRATVDALARMALRVEQTEKSGTHWQVTGTDGGVTVHVTSERVTGNMTKLSVRVEAGNLFADKKTGEELLNQVGASLASLYAGAPQGAPASAAPSAAQFSILQQAIDRLGTKAEDARDARDAQRSAGRPDLPTPSPTVTASPIITIPASAGVATLPGSMPTQMGQPSASVSRHEERETDLSSRLEQRKDPGEEVMARILSPVEVLTPVEGLTIGATRP